MFESKEQGICIWSRPKSEGQGQIILLNIMPCEILNIVLKQYLALEDCIFRMFSKNMGTDLSVILSEIDRGTDVQGCLC